MSKVSKLKIARLLAGIATQKDLAELLSLEAGIHIHPSLISHYEAGRVTPPAKTCFAIANILRRRQVDVTAEDLFSDQARV